ncbi:MAG: hypothetical protein QOJ09_1883, partial [Actinomycetota bacterium]|nr:hypothetical protein [Actinomycetota bacterium]
APTLTHPLTAGPSRLTWLRLVAAVLAIALVAIVAFTVGRSSADARPSTAKVTPVHQASQHCPPHFC